METPLLCGNKNMLKSVQQDGNQKLFYLFHLKISLKNFQTLYNSPLLFKIKSSLSAGKNRSSHYQGDHCSAALPTIYHLLFTMIIIVRSMRYRSPGGVSVRYNQPPPPTINSFCTFLYLLVSDLLNRKAYRLLFIYFFATFYSHLLLQLYSLANLYFLFFFLIAVCFALINNKKNKNFKKF